MTNKISKSNTSICQKLVRSDVATMTAYQSARRETTLSSQCWLNANEAGGNRQLQIALSQLNRYPDFQPKAVVEGYADYAGLEAEQVLATRGADEGIELLIRTFCDSGKDNILICPPTYGMYKVSAVSHGAGIVEVPLNSDFQLNINALTKQVGNVKLVFICSPNNPTGNVINRADIIDTLNLFKDSALVVLDEAYIEFCEQFTVTDLLASYPNLVVLRTLSKGFAYAGLRCGFTLASPDIIAMMSKIIAPYPLSQPVAEIAAMALTKQEIRKMRQRVLQCNELKQHVIEFLNKQPWLEALYESKTNFLLFKTALKQPLFDALVASGVMIRDQSSQPQLENCLRVSIGTDDELAAFYDAVNQFNVYVKSKRQQAQPVKAETSNTKQARTKY